MRKILTAFFIFFVSLVVNDTVFAMDKYTEHVNVDKPFPVNLSLFIFPKNKKALKNLLDKIKKAPMKMSFEIFPAPDGEEEIITVNTQEEKEAALKKFKLYGYQWWENKKTDLWSGAKKIISKHKSSGIALIAFVASSTVCMPEEVIMYLFGPVGLITSHVLHYLPSEIIKVLPLLGWSCFVATFLTSTNTYDLKEIKALATNARSYIKDWFLSKDFEKKKNN